MGVEETLVGNVWQDDEPCDQGVDLSELSLNGREGDTVEDGSVVESFGV